MLSQVRFSRRRQRDMSSGLSLDLLWTNSLTSPRPLPLFADSARLGPTDAELRGIEVQRNVASQWKGRCRESGVIGRMHRVRYVVHSPH